MHAVARLDSNLTLNVPQAEELVETYPMFTLFTSTAAADGHEVLGAIPFHALPPRATPTSSARVDTVLGHPYKDYF